MRWSDWERESEEKREGESFLCMRKRETKTREREF